MRSHFVLQCKIVLQCMNCFVTGGATTRFSLFECNPWAFSASGQIFRQVRTPRSLSKVDRICSHANSGQTQRESDSTRCRKWIRISFLSFFFSWSCELHKPVPKHTVVALQKCFLEILRENDHHVTHKVVTNYYKFNSYRAPVFSCLRSVDVCLWFLHIRTEDLFPFFCCRGFFSLSGVWNEI